MAPDASDLHKQVARDIHHSKVLVHMNKTMYVEISMLVAMLQHCHLCPISTPIAHPVKREPNFKLLGMHV